MIKTVKKLKQQLSTKEGFMDYASDITAKIVKAKAMANVGMITNAITAATHIRQIKDSNRRIVLTQAMLKYGFNIVMTSVAAKAYVSLANFNIRVNCHDIHCVITTNKSMDYAVEQLKTVNWNRIENIDAFLYDMSAYGRLMQETLIDSDKHILDIDLSLYQRVFKDASTIELAHNFKGFNDGKFNFRIFRSRSCIERDNRFVEVHKNAFGKVSRAYYNSPMADLQMTVSDSITGTMNELKSIYDTIELDPEIKDSFNLGTESSKIGMDFYNFIRILLSRVDIYVMNKKSKLLQSRKDNLIDEQNYAVSIDGLNKFYDSIKSCLNKEIQFFCSAMNYEEIGKLLVFVSNIKKTNSVFGFEIDDKATNKTFLRLFQRATLAWFLRNDHNGMGLRVQGVVPENSEGKNFEWANGICVEYPHMKLEDSYTGTLQLKSIDGKLYAVKDIEIPEYAPSTPELIYIPLYKNGLYDIYAEDFVKDPNADVKDNIEQFEKIVAYKKYENRINVIVGIDKDGCEKPIATYLCYSDEFGSKIDGMNCRTANCKVIPADENGSVLFLGIEYKNFMLKKPVIASIPMSDASSQDSAFCSSGITASTYTDSDAFGNFVNSLDECDDDEDEDWDD